MLTINEKLKAARIAISSSARYRFVIEPFVDEDGERVLFRNVTTGSTHTNLGSAADSVDSVGMVDYRIFRSLTASDPFGDFGTTRGANQLQSEIAVLNSLLGRDDVRPILEEAGLGHFYGKRLGGKLYKFNTGNQEKEQVIESIRNRFKLENMATVAVTDEGYTLFEYFMEDGTSITGHQGRVLQSILSSMSGETGRNTNADKLYEKNSFNWRLVADSKVYKKSSKHVISKKYFCWRNVYKRLFGISWSKF